MKLKKFIENNIDKIFYIILAVSLLVIFFRFITGNATYVYRDSGTDTLNQYYPFYINEAINIRNGTFSTWNFAYGLGTCLLNTTSWVFDIFGILLVAIGVLFGIDKIAYSLVLMQIIKIVVIFILTKKYLSYFVKDRTSICLASYITTMSGYIFLWGQHYFLGTSCVYMLLILCAIEHFLNQEEKHNSIVLSLVVASLLIYSYYVGYMVLLISGLYFVFRYFRKIEKFDFKELFKCFIKCGYSVLIGVLVAGIILLPACYNVLKTSSRLSEADANIFVKIVEALKTSFTPEFINERLVKLITTNSIYDYNDPRYYESAQLFCTIFIFFFMVQYVIYDFKNSKTKKDYILFVLKIIAMYLLLFNDITGLIFNVFVKPVYRYTFTILPIFAIMIGTVWEKIVKNNSINKIGLLISIIISIYTCVVAKKMTIIESNREVLITILIFMFFGYIILLFLALFSKKVENEKIKNLSFIFQILFIIVVAISTTFENYLLTNHRFYLAKDDKDIIMKLDKDGNAGATGKALKWLKEYDPSFYRVELAYCELSMAGDSFVNQNSTTTYYNSTMNPFILEFYQKIYKNANFQDIWKMCSIYFGKIERQDLESLHITNSKYILVPSIISGIDELEEIKEIDGLRIYRNKNTESIAKFYTKTLTDKEYIELPEYLEAEVLYDHVILDKEIETDENATAEVGQFYLEKPTYLKGSVKCDGKGVLMISVPFQKGWFVSVDGVEKSVYDLYRADYGFIGVPVSEGKHFIELRYRLPKLEIGIACTTLGIVNLFGILIARKIKKKKILGEKNG